MQTSNKNLVIVGVIVLVVGFVAGFITGCIHVGNRYKDANILFPGDPGYVPASKKLFGGHRVSGGESK